MSSHRKFSLSQFLESINRIFFGVKPSSSRKRRKKNKTRALVRTIKSVSSKDTRKDLLTKIKAAAGAPVPLVKKGSVPGVAVTPQGQCRGEITHYFSRIQVAVVKMTAGYLRIGDKIVIQGKQGNFSQTVTSLQVESVDVKAAQKGQIIGMKVIKEPRVGDKVYKVARSQGRKVKRSQGRKNKRHMKWKANI